MYFRFIFNLPHNTGGDIWAIFDMKNNSESIILIDGKYRKIISNDVLIIDEDMFQGTNIKSIVIPRNVEEIKSEAFYECSKLEKVALNEGLKKIGSEAFIGTKIKSITIPSTVEEIGGGAFVDIEVSVADGNKRYEVINNCLIEKDTKKLICGNINSVIPFGIKEIDRHAFYKSKIESLEIPGSVRRIKEATFIYCSKLKTVVLNEGLEEICESVFAGTKIESIVIPSTVTKIHGDSFNKIVFAVAEDNLNYEVLGSCLIERKTKKIISDGIDSVVPKDFNGIGCNAFFKSKIERIEIPKTVEEIDTGAMYGAGSLKTIVLNEGLKTIGKSAFDGTAIKEISIPSTVQKIKECAFMDCSKLQLVTLNAGLKVIEAGAFHNTRISEIVIPDTVESMEGFVFSNCKKLKKIYCISKSKPDTWDNEWNGKSFDNDKKHKVVWGYTGK